MSKDTPQARGRQWEEELGELIGGELVPMSGAGVRKLDVAGQSLLISAKHTDAASFRVDAAMLTELRDATMGSGGVGAEVTPMMAIRGRFGRPVAVIDLQDLIALLQSNPEGLIKPSKDAERRARASRPSLFRED